MTGSPFIESCHTLWFKAEIRAGMETAGLGFRFVVKSTSNPMNVDQSEWRCLGKILVEVNFLFATLRNLIWMVDIQFSGAWYMESRSLTA